MSYVSDGMNKDEGKLRLDLVPPEAIEAIARVAGQACETGKYPERNWEKGMEWTRQYASAQRHLLKWMKGEDNDLDTGLPHLEHALWRIAALITYARRRIGEDDRPEPLSADDHDVHIQLAKAYYKKAIGSVVHVDHPRDLPFHDVRCVMGDPDCKVCPPDYPEGARLDQELGA